MYTSINILGFEHYLIDDSGKVYITKNRKGRLLKEPKLKVLSKTKKGGYLQAVLKSTSGVIKGFYVHRLVAQHFIPNPENLCCVCHKDDNPENNCSSNLFWGSYLDNMLDKIKKGRQKGRIWTEEQKLQHSIKLRGKRRPYKFRSIHHSILQFNTNGVFIKEWDSATAAAKYFNCTESSIICALKGSSKTSMGYVWKYKNPKFS